MANSNFVVQNGIEVGPTKIFAGNGTIVMGGGLESAGAAGGGATNFQQDINIVTGNLTVSTSNIAIGFDGLTDNILTLAANTASFLQVALHNANSGTSASSDFIAYADTGDNTQGYVDIGIASSVFDDPAYAVTFAGDSYIFASAPAGTGGNLVLATENGTYGDIVFAAGGFSDGTIQGRFITGDGLEVTGNLISDSGAIYQGPGAKSLLTSTEATTTLSGTINSSATTINVVSTTGFFNHGALYIDDETVYYFSKTATSFTSVTRGTSDSTAVSHTSGATVSQFFAGLTNASTVLVGNADGFVQVSLKNTNSGASASTDIIAYTSNGDNDSGWIDMGITSETYNDATYGVTGPDDGYIFMSAPQGAIGGGSLFLSTGGNGIENDIVFTTGGFTAGNERVRIVGTSRAGRPAGVEVNIATSSTSTTTGALRVNGGVGLIGNLYVGGNVEIIGNISFGGQGTSVTTTNITVDAPMSFLGNSNPGDAFDIGVVGQYIRGGGTKYNGLVREAATGLTRFFSDATTKPTNTVTFNGTHSGLVFGSANVANATTSTSTTTGALTVAGGVGISGNLSLSSSQVINIAGSPGTSGQFLSSTGTGLNWVTLSASSISNGTSNVTVASSGVVTLGVASSNVAFVSTTGIHPMANASVNLGDSTHWYNLMYGKAYQAQYADLAENYQADKAYAPGTVVMFGGTEEVTVADVETTAVAGVVSTNPAHLMNGGLTGVNVVPLALQGRVPCNVIGPIKKGDMMVSAGFGYAKASKTPVVGQVIGKALADFGGAKGQIEVVVGRV